MDLQQQLLNLLVLCFTTLATVGSQQYPGYMLEPFSVRGVVGCNVTIYCQVNTVYTRRNVYWALPNNEGAIGPNINTNNNYDRHQFVGDPAQGFYNLQIRDVTEQDSGSYSCIFTNDGSSPDDTFTMEAAALLNVTTDGKAVTSLTCPDIEYLESEDGNDTDNLPFRNGNPLPNFSCSAQGGVPLADSQELKWHMLLRNNSVIDVPSVTTVDPSGTGSVTATIDSEKFSLTGHHDNSVLICAAGPLETESTFFCDTPNGATGLGNDDKRIRVLYEPLVGFLPSRIEVGMFEQYELYLKCFADSNPSITGPPTLQLGDISNVSMVSTGNDSLIDGRMYSRVLLSVSRGDVGRVINCTATNNEGETTTVSIEIEPLGGLPAWLICVIIFIGGFFAFLILVLCLSFICRCDLEHERKHRERRRRTFRDSKVNGVHTRQDLDDDFDDLDLRAYDNPPAMMPESPQDSGNYAESDEGSDGLVNDFKIEEPDGETHHVMITSDQEFDDDDDDPPKKPDYLQVTIADDTAGEEMELEELSRDRSPSLNEL